MILDDLVSGELTPTFAISTHYLLPQTDNQGEWDVVTKRKEFQCIDDAFDLIVEALEDLGFERNEVLNMMYNYSAIVEGEMRDEIHDILSEIDTERDGNSGGNNEL